MEVNQIVCIDALKGLVSIPDKTVTLVVTSPPYAKIRKSYSGPSAIQFVNWFLPFAKEVLRVLKDDGSFIIDIQDQVENGERIPYAFELTLRMRDLGFKYIDTIIWAKKNGAKTAGRRRSNYFEYILHFSKTVQPIWNPDSIRAPYAATSVTRAKKPIKQNVSNKESRSQTLVEYKEWKLHPMGAFPKNVIYFPKDPGKSGHPAPFHIDLPTHFIKAHSNENDLILDIFAGKGTTCQAAKNLNRKYLGFEIKQEYIEIAKKEYGLESKTWP